MNGVFGLAGFVLYPLVRRALFLLEAERAHEFAARRLEAVGRSERLTRILRARYFHEDPRLGQDLWGLRFPNPVGMAAGFDKNARLVRVLPNLGFGFVEVGTVTSEAQAGNPRPRMFRLPADQAIINRLGFNNEGAESVAARLARSGPYAVPVGVNIGKLRKVPNADATADYLRTFERLHPYGDYFVVNVSSPNTPGLRELQAHDFLQELVRALRQRNAELARAQGAKPRPLLVKVAPDLQPKELEEVVEVARSERLDGIVATNTTLSRAGLRAPIQEEGGLSGAPLRERSTAIIRQIHEQTDGELPIIGVGGVFSANDAWEKIRAGASLIQLYTGFIYGGPRTASDIHEGLVELLDQHGYEHIADAVGSG